MNTDRVRAELAERYTALRCIPADESIFFTCAGIFPEMISGYLSDGDRFLAQGDLTNAWASYWYALGWMDAGLSLGLITTGTPWSGDILAPLPVPGTEKERLAEKTSRYHALLSRALGSLSVAAEPGSCLAGPAERILFIGDTFYRQGTLLEKAGNLASALSASSYCFGWLDAGVRLGLFRVTDHRDLFTI